MDNAGYAELFLTESREHVSAINHSLLELERGAGGDEPLSAIFRAVHTIKGMSATMGYTPVASLSHELETLLDRMRRGARAIDEPLMDLLFRAADLLEIAIESSVTGSAESVDVGPLIALLKSDDGAELSPSLAPDAAPSAPRSRTKGTRTARFTAAAPTGAAMLVRVRLREETPLKGVRAFLVVQAARALGDVIECSPTLAQLQEDAFDDDFAIRLETSHSPAEVESRLAQAGDVAEVIAGPRAERVRIIVRAPATERPEALKSAGSESTERTISGNGNGNGNGQSAKAANGTGSNGASAAASGSRLQRSVRIDLRRLDSLMNLIGELVITRGRLVQLCGGIDDPALIETVAQTSRLVADLQDEIMTSRMVPVWQVFDRFPRLVRDAAHSVHKQVDFVIEGKEVELDRSMLDEVGDPIVHLLRNAIDHGIEAPDVRRANGKPDAGRLTLSALRDRSAVSIRVTDDGRGIDRDRVLQRARATGLVEPEREELSDDELLRIISRPGFSTADAVSDLSGRGVGIDAVHNRVRALGGSVDIRTAPGEGTTVTLRLPLTLAIVRSLLARVGEEIYAIPMTHVSETVELAPTVVGSVQGRDVLLMRDEVLPLLRLRQLVCFEGAEPSGTEQVVIVELAEHRVALVVDALIGQQEIVVKQFDGVRDGVQLFGGATILGDGAPALIVDVSSLL